MQWKKAPEQTKQLLADAAAGIDCVNRVMFGYPACFVNGNMFAGVYQSSIVVRLPLDAHPALRSANPQLRAFEPIKGRIMKEYLELPDAAAAHKALLKVLVRKAHAYAASLPAKKARK